MARTHTVTMSVENVRLARRLGLFDVFVVSTGAMFSSFFLLPGLAAGETGASVVLAFVVSGVLIVPALVSQAELATAMPRAGGTYYYLDRTMGPLVGTAGGVGTWLTLVLKTAFALIGMGAYLSLVFEVAITPIAIGCTVAFGAINVFGARESSRLLRFLVVSLLGLLVIFIAHGLAELFPAESTLSSESYFVRGFDGFAATVGLVFVSYIGLTKVTSLAEEVENPDRNIPLGMSLALICVVAVYALGVTVMVTVLGVQDLSASLTPVTDTAQAFSNWLPVEAWIALTVFAAVIAFASMSNAGILAASRYPLAMARDGLVPSGLATIGRFGTPTRSIVLTCALIIVALIVFNVEDVAKLAGAVQLAIFGLINVAVVVMRESRIEAYDPGFKAPLYPWMQFIGIVVPIVLVAEMGWLPVLFTLGVIFLGVGWFQYYARARIEREGAIFHVFARLGRRRFVGLDRELRDIMKEKGLRAEDPFDEVVARADVIDEPDVLDLSAAVENASRLLSARLPITAATLCEALSRNVHAGGTPVVRGAALLHARLPAVEMSELVVVRCAHPLRVDIGDEAMRRQAAQQPVHAVFLLVSGERDPGQHLRILAQIAGRIEDDGFIDEWLSVSDEQELKETVLRDDRFLALRLKSGDKTEPLIGKALRDLSMPEGSLVALIRRYGVTVVPRGRTVLREGDRLTIIGEPVGLRELDQRYGRNE